MTKLDGLDVFKSLFSSDDDLIDHLIGGVLFFPREIVREQAKEVGRALITGVAIPVRYNSNGPFFFQREKNKTTLSFKNKSKAVEYTNDESNKAYHKDTRIRIRFDSDGNYVPKRTILAKTGHKVSCGQQSTVVNYVIAHIWDKTDKPLFFSLMWNYCLIPSHCAYLTDKREDSDKTISRIKNLLKAISIELYNSNRLMDWNQDVIPIEELPPKEARTEAKQLIAENRINYLASNDTTCGDITTDESEINYK